jgi:hypothetical protein
MLAERTSAITVFAYAEVNQLSCCIQTCFGVMNRPDPLSTSALNKRAFFYLM